MARTQTSSTLRQELEHSIRSGRCAYCRRPAAPDEPLTREHVIPQAKGGRRKDVRIIVPACASCNQHRGCQELALFLLLRPRRISAFLDYLGTLSTESIQQMDMRVFAELYAAVWLLRECAGRGEEWREQLKRACSGRTLHRRRYAARRMVWEVGGRMEQRRNRATELRGPGCLIPLSPSQVMRIQLEEPLEQLTARLLGLLSLLWQVPAEDVHRELARGIVEPMGHDDRKPEEDEEGVLPLDGWKRRRRQRRYRVDRRGGRRRVPGQVRGRAA